MSGPIVRTGTTPKFWENWEKVFGKKKPKAGAARKKTAAKKSAKKKGSKSKK